MFKASERKNTAPQLIAHQLRTFESTPELTQQELKLICGMSIIVAKALGESRKISTGTKGDLNINGTSYDYKRGENSIEISYEELEFINLGKFKSPCGRTVELSYKGKKVFEASSILGSKMEADVKSNQSFEWERELRTLFRYVRSDKYPKPEIKDVA